MNAVLVNNSEIIESYKKRKSISCSLRINFNIGHLWELISSPGYLEKCHPFCKTNNVIDWDDKKHMDKIVYVNGIEYIRDFIDWNPKKGYSLIIGKKGGRQSYVSWEIKEITSNSTEIKITVYPHEIENMGKFKKFLIFNFYVVPKLKFYLNCVLKGIDYYLKNNEEVPRNHFGKHSWFS